MKGDLIPPPHHVVRHCGKTKLEWSDDQTCKGVLGIAFIPDADHTVSVVWVEYFPGTDAERLAAVRKVIQDTRKTSANQRLAMLNVGTVISVGAACSRNVRVEHDPVLEPPADRNPAHSVILGIEPEDAILMDRIALEVLAIEAMIPRSC